MITFRDATEADFDELAALYAAAAADLTARFGEGRWSRDTVVRPLRTDPGHLCVRVGCTDDAIVSALRLHTRRPWAIDAECFTAVERPLYLTGMVVSPSHQRRGLGRAALDDAHRVARAWPADAIRLDAYDAAAGAGPFYGKCGYVERGRVVYRGNPLVYFEYLLA